MGAPFPFVVRQPTKRFLHEGLGSVRTHGRNGRTCAARRLVARAVRNVQRERGALPVGALRGNIAPMKLDEFLNESQSYAGAFVGSPACAFHPVKALEQPGYFLLRYSDSGVAHGE